MKKDFTIQITRIIAMFMIILCHLVQEVNNKYIQLTAQFFNVGVFIFIFISGYLYGNKNIDNCKTWFKNRFIKIMIPVYIFMICIFGFQILVSKNFELKYVFIYLFDLQFILGGVHGAQHLWFLTIIMLLYMITPILYKNKEKLLKNNKKILITIFIIAIICAYINENIGRTLMYILLYISAYIYRNINKNTKKSKILLCIGMVALFGIRVISRKFFDGTVFYNTIVVCITQILLTYNIYWLINEILKGLNMKENKFLNHFDNISYYIYITHIMFISGPISLMGITQNMLLNSIISIICSWICAYILYKISRPILSFNERN